MRAAPASPQARTSSRSCPAAGRRTDGKSRDATLNHRNKTNYIGFGTVPTSPKRSESTLGPEGSHENSTTDLVSTYKLSFQAPEGPLKSPSRWAGPVLRCPPVLPHVRMPDDLHSRSALANYGEEGEGEVDESQLQFTVCPPLRVGETAARKKARRIFITRNNLVDTKPREITLGGAVGLVDEETLEGGGGEEGEQKRNDRISWAGLRVKNTVKPFNKKRNFLNRWEDEVVNARMGKQDAVLQIACLPAKGR